MSRRRRIYERFYFLHWLFHYLRQSFSEDLHSIVDHLGMRDFHWLYWGLRPSKRVSPRANFADTKPALYLLIIDLKSRSILHLHLWYYFNRWLLLFYIYLTSGDRAGLLWRWFDQVLYVPQHPQGTRDLRYPELQIVQLLEGIDRVL